MKGWKVGYPRHWLGEPGLWAGRCLGVLDTEMGGEKEEEGAQRPGRGSLVKGLEKEKRGLSNPYFRKTTLLQG